MKVDLYRYFLVKIPNGTREFPQRYSHFKIRYFSLAEDGDGFLRRVSKDGFYFDAQIVDFYWSANHQQV